MLKVFKYPLGASATIQIEMPRGARVLTVQSLGFQEDRGRDADVARILGAHVLWALVDPTAPPEVRTFHIRATGQPITEEDSMVYHGTFQLEGGRLAFHVFEDGEQLLKRLEGSKLLEDA